MKTGTTCGFASLINLPSPGCGRRKEKGSMISYQHDGSRVIDGLDMLQTINSHQVIARDVNPAGAEEILTPGPETLPATQVHPMRHPKGEALEAREDG